MMSRIVTVLSLMLLAVPALAQDQPAPQRGGCASGFCSMSNAPQQEAGAEADIDAVEADMKRQLSGQAKGRAPQMAMGGMMGMCPCMRMMAMMMRGHGMHMPDMPQMQMPGMGSMPGMAPMPGMGRMPGMTPMPDKAPAVE